jgi:hypothetical protein
MAMRVGMAARRSGRAESERFTHLVMEEDEFLIEGRHCVMLDAQKGAVRSLNLFCNAFTFFCLFLFIVSAEGGGVV